MEHQEAVGVDLNIAVFQVVGVDLNKAVLQAVEVDLNIVVLQAVEPRAVDTQAALLSPFMSQSLSAQAEQL